MAKRDKPIQSAQTPFNNCLINNITVDTHPQLLNPYNQNNTLQKCKSKNTISLPTSFGRLN